jgi:predicted DNA-binding protein YlxM (UPF0122 family)
MREILNFEPIDVDLSWPKQKPQIQSSVYPDREYSFNEIAETIAIGSKQTNLERIQNTMKPFKTNTLIALKTYE